MKDVAQLANVSEMTVSRVMRKSGYVSDTISEKVKYAASQLGYTPNKLAGGLASDQSNLVGVIVPSLTNVVFAELLSGIADALHAAQLQPVFGVSNYDEETEEQIILDMLAWRPKGLILSGLQHTDLARITLESANIRLAEVMDIDGTPISAGFGISHIQAATDMAQHLYKRGYRQFGLIGAMENQDIRGAARLTTFATEIEKLGGTVVKQIFGNIPSSMMLGKNLTQQIISNNHQIDALYFANDDLAAGALMHTLEQKISVPQDLAIASFNGLDFLQALPLQITTTKSPRYEIGYAAGSYMAAEHDTEPPLKTFPYEMITGETS